MTQWIACLKDCNMLVTPGLLKFWANRALARAGEPGHQVGKNWPYRFMKRLPKCLDLGPVKQKTKEWKRIQVENTGLLPHWYDLLANLLKHVPARLVYNFDECGFALAWVNHVR